MRALVLGAVLACLPLGLAAQPLGFAVEGNRIALGAGDISNVRIEGGALAFDLPRGAREGLARLTRRAQGRVLVATICGETVLEAQLRAPLDTPSMVVVPDDPERYLPVLRGETPCP